MPGIHRERPGADAITPATDAHAVDVGDGVWLSPGLSNSYLITSSDGRVVVNSGMGFGSLGACSFEIIGIVGLGGPLKANDLSTFGALDAHHKASHPGALVSANTADGTNNLIKLQVDPGNYPSAAGAKLPACHGLHWRPGDSASHFSSWGPRTSNMIRLKDKNRKNQSAQ